MHKIKGKPDKFDNVVIGKLEVAFRNGCSIAEACLHADISTSTFYRNVDKESELYEYFMELKDEPLKNARMNLVQDITKGDVESSKWYLERKAKEEFSTRVDNKQDTEITINLTSNRKK